MATRVKRSQHLLPILSCRFLSRTRGVSFHRFSTSSQKKAHQKGGKDEPVAFSKSKAKFHTVDDTLGISKTKKSNFPLFFGLTLFTVIIYFGFIRREPNSSPESLEDLLERIRVLHEEKLKKQTEKMRETENEESE